MCTAPAGHISTLPAEMTTPPAPASPVVNRSVRAMPGPANRSLSLFLVSVLGLYLELLLIRWIGTEVNIFSYLQNTILVICFLGLGMGCFSCRRPIRLHLSLIPLIVLLVLLALPPTRALLGSISLLLSATGDLVIWDMFEASDPLASVGLVVTGLVLTFFLMILVWAIFLPIGRLLGRLMDDHPHVIWAYSVNVAGSLLGIWLFVLLSALSLSPFAWFAVAALLFAPFVLKAPIDALLVTAVLPLAWMATSVPGALEVVWSPYQKLVLADALSHQFTWTGRVVHVNNAGYQALIDLSEEATLSDPIRYRPELRGLSQYDIPLLLHPSPKNVLIVGAGTGNDVAGALRGGAEEVVAVEIDPAIVEMGRSYHDERPYASDRVQVVETDARSFFATDSRRYDVIVFGLLDSHTTTAMTNARLDHYVYTRESLARARTLLADGGVLVLSFEAQRAFIADRMARALRDVFGFPAITFRVPHSAYGWGGVLFVTGDIETARRSIESNARLAAAVERWTSEHDLGITFTTEVTTDDWPYLYLEGRRIPTLYYLLAIIVAALFWVTARPAGLNGLMKRWTSTEWHFFFLGAGFLLLEVQNISKAAVVLGNTWLVNAVIISGILAMILAANWVAAIFRRLPLAPVYGALLLSCLGLYFLDLAVFGFLPYMQKAVLVGTLTTLPIFFSGIIFIRSFADVPRRDTALGANLIGALVGGLLQTTTFVLGIKALLLLVAALYLGALLSARGFPLRARAAG
jgi:spermidine synthase